MRRLKSTRDENGCPIIRLPKRTVNVVQAPFASDEERAFYDAMETQTQVHSPLHACCAAGNNVLHVLQHGRIMRSTPLVYIQQAVICGSMLHALKHVLSHPLQIQFNQFVREGFESNYACILVIAGGQKAANPKQYLITMPDQCCISQHTFGHFVEFPRFVRMRVLYMQLLAALPDRRLTTRSVSCNCRCC